ncbi:hypothetical protein EIN_168240, partial [Entamoeba invadens IP1]
MSDPITVVATWTPPKTTVATLEWLKVSEGIARNLLKKLSKRDLVISNLETLNEKIEQILSYVLTRPAYNAFGLCLFAIQSRLKIRMTNPSVLRPYYADKSVFISKEDAPFHLSEIKTCLASDQYEVIPSFFECVKRSEERNKINATEIVSELLWMVCYRFIHTQDNKEWGFLKESYEDGVLILDENGCIEQFKNAMKISWKCKAKYPILAALANKCVDNFIAMKNQIIPNIFVAIKETTFRSSAIALMVKLTRLKIAVFEDFCTLLETNLDCLALTSAIYNNIKDDLEQFYIKTPLLAAATAKLNNVESDVILERIDKDIIASAFTNSNSESFNVVVIFVLHSEQTRVNATNYEVEMSIEIVKGICDCPTKETQSIASIFPKFITRCTEEQVSTIFDHIAKIIETPFSEKVDAFFLQVFATLLKTTKRVDLATVVVQKLSQKVFVDLLVRSFASRTDKLRSLAYTFTDLILPHSSSYLDVIKKIFKPQMLLSLRAAEADCAAQHFSLLTKLKTPPLLVLENGDSLNVNFLSQSPESAIQAIVKIISEIATKIKPTNCEVYKKNCLYGLFRILQILHKESLGYTTAIEVVESSDVLLTLPAPEGSNRSMVVGGWMSVRVASEIISVSTKQDFLRGVTCLTKIVRTALHRGIFERASMALEKSLEWSTDQWLGEEVDRVLDDVEKEVKFTRRSAGLPYHLVSLLNEECRRVRSPTQSPPLLEKVVKVLNSYEGKSSIHAMNILGAMVKSQKIAEELDLFFPTICVEKSIKMIDDPDWSVRNSASILVSSLIKRVFATKEHYNLTHLSENHRNILKVLIEGLRKGGNAVFIVSMILENLDFLNTNDIPEESEFERSERIATHQKSDFLEDVKTLENELVKTCWKEMNAPNVEILAEGIVKCCTRNIIPKLIEKVNGVVLCAVNKYVRNGIHLTHTEISEIRKFKPENSYECFQFLNLLNSLHFKLPKITQFRATEDDAYTLKIVRLLSYKQAEDPSELQHLLLHENVVVRESALAFCEEHPQQVDPKMVFKQCEKLLTQSVPHILCVLRTMRTILVQYPSLVLENSSSIVSQIKTLIQSEPLLTRTGLGVVLRLETQNTCDFSRLDKCDFNFALKNVFEKNKKENVIGLIDALLNNENALDICLAYNQVFGTNLDVFHLVKLLLHEETEESGYGVCHVLLKEEMFEELDENT